MKIANIPSTAKLRLQPQKPNRIVIHAMGEYIDTDDKDYHAKEWLDKLGLAAHYLVTPTGVIIKTLDIDLMGAHAKGYNFGSVGIEFLVPGVHTYSSFLKAIELPYLTDVQYEEGLQLVDDLCLALDQPVTIDTHAELSPDRKVDPGKGFPLESFLSNLENYGTIT